jgi:hypothetical protein
MVMEEKLIELIVVIIKFIIASFVLYLLWNWLMPDLFSIGKITFGQSMGVKVICNILFKDTTTKK